MAGSIDPLKEEFLAVVTSWSAYGQKGGLVGSAIPVFCTSRTELVLEPTEMFPDPGYVFLVNRGPVAEWDFILVRPKKNDKYVPGKSYYLSFDIPAAQEAADSSTRYASILDLPAFDPTSVAGLIRNPPQNVTPVFFVRYLRRFYGPLKRIKVNRKSGSEAIDSLQWAPYGDDSSIYEFAEEDLPKYKLEKVSYRHPNPDDEPIARNPIYLLTGPVTAVRSERTHDRLSPAELAEWYLRWRGMASVPEELLKVFRSAPDQLGDLTPEIIRQRCRRLATLFGTLDILQSERASAAERYIMSEPGQKILQQHIEREIEKRTKQIDVEVARQKKEQSKEKYELKRELDELQADHRRKVQQLTREREELERKKASAELAVRTVQKQMQEGLGELTTRLQAEVPVFAALSAGMRPMSVAVDGVAERPLAASMPSPAASGWGRPAIPEKSKELADLIDEPAFVDNLAWELAGESLYFTRDFLANLYVTLKSSALNLIMGPPGYGKSSVVSALARAMGHGNALLDIAVRRTWSDDRYLLGFYDTFHGRYDPGPTGLATRLLQAQLDWEKGREGLYMILMDEFNLAAPEYYFSQLLQILTRPMEQTRALRLYDPGPHAGNGEKVVDTLRINPNVSFWGTINYDETTERLSPRLLDRTGMIFLGVRDVVPTAAGPGTRGRSAKGVKAGQWVDAFVRGPDRCPESCWELIEPLLGMLKKPSEEWGPGTDLSPRMLEAIRRYLANSEGVLPPERAVDFAFEQRVLPVLRGRGAQFTARIRALQERLIEKGLERSSRHVQDALALAEINFGDMDFLAY